MTRTAVLADIHGNLPALEAVVADAEGKGCTGFLNLGDCLSSPLWPAETADYLMARDWPTIAGNHERQLLTVPPDRMNATDRFTRERLTQAHLAWLGSLPPVRSIDSIFLCHGTPRSDIEHFLETVTESGMRAATEQEVARRLGDRWEAITFCGHSHQPGKLTLSDGRRVVNPGSVGLQAFVDDRPFPYRVEIGDPRARYAILEDGAVEFVAIDYDHRAAAAKARREGRDDWAGALATGRVESD